MTSIRTKLFRNISCLVIFFVLISWALSAMFLEEFYVWHKKRSLIESSQAIDALYHSGSGDISLELERNAASLGGGIVILDTGQGQVKYSSFERLLQQRTLALRPRSAEPEGPGQSGAHPPGPPPVLTESREAVDDATNIEIEHDPALNITFMVLTHQLSADEVLVIRLPRAAVAESASYASKFMALSGLLAILAGCIWAYFFARRFTVPLLEVNQVARSISRLDFSQKCAIHSNDEVGSLAESINDLSVQLHLAISELNEKNSQLLADVENERRLDKLRKNFISSVSHELKTPISLILGYAEGLRENVAQDEENKNYYCSVIQDEAEKMDKLVKDLLDLSQIESGYFHLERRDFDLSPLLDSIALKYRTIFAEKNIAFTLERPAFLLVNGDDFRLEQVLVNLLNNAISHASGAKAVELRVAQAGPVARVSVFNTGPPIPAESLDNLWLSFYKVDQARTRGSGGGYGLGLSIVRAIQELHDSAYGVENVENGVVFWFEISKAEYTN
ncbi:MAG TPA: HAMP domain-containing sensor histidine kinase [Selenomonadales bacterium]|nr:HAMP domain-containing sensor histidine kinase [Selenomonadales bacterium]